MQKRRDVCGTGVFCTKVLKSVSRKGLWLFHSRNGTKSGRCYLEKTSSEACPGDLRWTSTIFMQSIKTLMRLRQGLSAVRMIHNALSGTDRSPFQRMQDIYEHGGDAVWVEQY